MKIICQDRKTAYGKAGLLGLGCFESDPDFLKQAPLGENAKKRILEIVRRKQFTGKSGESFLVSPAGSGTTPCLLLGLGKKEKYILTRVRIAAAKLLSQAKALGCRDAALDLDRLVSGFSAVDIAAAAAEGARLSDYSFAKYKSKPSPRPAVEFFYLVSGNRRQLAGLQQAVRRAEIVSECVLFARNLANEPANVMTPVRLASAARQMAARHGLRCRVLGRKQIERLGMGGLRAVSQGSANPPQFIILENRARAGAAKPVVLVGKGITFDTGGISLKPSNDMDKMKFDMCGAAAVIGTLRAAADLKLSRKVIGLVPVCENMPGGTAQRPGDIITCLNKKTVEVLNTDAEGRLILADALAYAARYKPAAIIDIATLTGACSATFSDLATGLMTTDPALAAKLKEAGEHTGERLWELPLWDEYADLIQAAYADIQNISKKSAGTITAAMFLKEFADHTKSWAHLDIAGTAYNEGGAKPLSPIGATGVGVRLLTRYLETWAR